jgi:hypothetical protein
LKLKGRQLGAFKTAAKRAGLHFDEYLRRIDSGLKRCIACCAWMSNDKFGCDETRWDHKDSKCTECKGLIGRGRYAAVPFDQVRIPGHVRAEPRSGDKIQARQLINKDVQSGFRPSPNSLHRAYCGHKGDNRRHEYHHHLGYSTLHHYDVLALCSKCHAASHMKENA